MVFHCKARESKFQFKPLTLACLVIRGELQKVGARAGGPKLAAGWVDVLQTEVAAVGSGAGILARRWKWLLLQGMEDFHFVEPIVRESALQAVQRSRVPREVGHKRRLKLVHLIVRVLVHLEIMYS